MSVLLNITMPKTCEVCPCNDDNWRCGATGEYFDYDDMYEKRRDDCPLIELPPHGRLIDKDKLRHDLFVNFNGERIPFYDCDNFPTKISYRDVHSILAEQKTVIEAEGETDGR